MNRTPRATRTVKGGRRSVYARLPATPELHMLARVGSERFAFPIAHVEEVVDAPRVTWVPLAPVGLLGQLRYRDLTVSAYDGGWAFGVEREGTDGTALVLREGAHRLALVVDDVEDLQVIEPESVRAVPAGADVEGVLCGVCLASWRGGGVPGLANLVMVPSLVARAVALDAPDSPVGSAR